MTRELRFLVVALVLSALTVPVAGLAILKRPKHYTFTAAQASEYDMRVHNDQIALAAGAKGEHRLARMERLAHDYAYGSGINKGWNSVRALARLKADGFELVETLMNAEDGMAAIVVKDKRTGGHVIAFRGTDTVLTGWNRHGCAPELDPDAYTDLIEANYAEIGVNQFHAHRNIMKRWARQYGKDGKLQVTGHSLGGGLAGLFTASYPTVVKKLVTFQAPAQLPASARRYEQAMAKLPPDERPENVAVISINDAVSCAGEIYVGSPKMILTLADNMGITKAFWHLSFVMQGDQSAGTSMGTGKYRDPKDNLIRVEMDYKEFQAFRSVAQLKGSHSIIEKRRKWDQFAELLRVCLRDRCMLDMSAGRPLDPDGKTPPPVVVQDQIHELSRELYSFEAMPFNKASVTTITGRYVRALRILRDQATGDELRKNYDAEVELWAEIEKNTISLRDDRKARKKVNDVNIKLLTRRYHLLRTRQKILAPDGELMLAVLVRGRGAKIKNVGATVRIDGPSGTFIGKSTGSVFRNLAPGHYRIHVFADGFEPALASVNLTKQLPKKRLRKLVMMRAIPKWIPPLSLPAPAGTVQVIARVAPAGTPVTTIYIRISQPEKQYMEGYGRILRFWNLAPGRYDLAVLDSGFQSDVKTVELTAEQITNGVPIVLTLRKIYLGQPQYDSEAYVKAIRTYYETYHATLTNAKGYTEAKRDELEQLQLAALRHQKSFPHNKVAALWKKLHVEKDARKKEWRDVIRKAPLGLKGHTLQVREEDRPKLRSLLKQIEALDKKAHEQLDAIKIPKDNWNSSPSRLFREKFYGKARNVRQFLPSPPHPANWTKGSKLPMDRLPAALKALTDNFRLFRTKRREIGFMLGSATSLKTKWKPRIEEVKRLTKEVADMKAAKKKGN